MKTLISTRENRRWRSSGNYFLSSTRVSDRTKLLIKIRGEAWRIHDVNTVSTVAWRKSHLRISIFLKRMSYPKKLPNRLRVIRCQDEQMTAGGWQLVHLHLHNFGHTASSINYGFRCDILSRSPRVPLWTIKANGLHCGHAHTHFTNSHGDTLLLACFDVHN